MQLTGSFPSASSYEGMFAYDTGNNPYVADSGGWVKILTENSSVLQTYQMLVLLQVYQMAPSISNSTQVDLTRSAIRWYWCLI